MTVIVVPEIETTRSTSLSMTSSMRSAMFAAEVTVSVVAVVVVIAAESVVTASGWLKSLLRVSCRSCVLVLAMALGPPRVLGEQDHAQHRAVDEGGDYADQQERVEGAHDAVLRHEIGRA